MTPRISSVAACSAVPGLREIPAYAALALFEEGPTREFVKTVHLKIEMAEYINEIQKEKDCKRLAMRLVRALPCT